MAAGAAAVMGSWDTPAPGLSWLGARAAGQGVLAAVDVGILMASVNRPRLAHLKSPVRARLGLVTRWLKARAQVGALPCYSAAVLIAPSEALASTRWPVLTTAGPYHQRINGYVLGPSAISPSFPLPGGGSLWVPDRQSGLTRTLLVTSRGRGQWLYRA